jgi:hypothetical protein
MTLVIAKPSTAKLVLAKTYVGIDDPDAAAYIAAVEAADETASPGVGALETATKVAIHSFVKGCKADGIWPAIKASCILAGAKTLSGALVPLVGTAPTNVSGNFVSDDYNRKTGLGTGSTTNTNKRLNLNVTPSQIGGQDNAHAAVYASGARIASTTNAFIGATTAFLIRATSANLGTLGINNVGNSWATVGNSNSSIGLYGGARNTSNNVDRIEPGNSAITSLTSASVTPTTTSILLFAEGATPTNHSSGKFSFYSVGTYLSLTLLRDRVNTLMTAIGAAF